MKPYAVVCFRAGLVRGAHAIYDQGRNEAVGYPQQNAPAVNDPRDVDTPVDVWWADNEDQAKGVLLSLTEHSPNKTFVMLKSVEMAQSVVDACSVHRSKFTNQGLLPV